MTTSQLPFLMKCPVPESRDENLSFRSIPKSQPTLFTPTGTCYELQTSTSSYAPLTLPYQSRDVVTNCHNCSCCNQEARRWSMALQKNQMEKRNDFIPKVTQLSQEQFSRHRILHEARAAEENARETAATATSGKRTRTAFTPIQLLVLETAFENNHYVVGMERKRLAIYLKLTEQQVKVWYQNRRTKYKKNIGQNF